jgi:integrase/recombinase XerC
MSVTRYALNKNKYLLGPELERLNTLLDSHMEEDLRNCLLLKLALKTGARAQELLNLKKIDINSYEESILIHGIKGSNDREIPIKSDVFRLLKKYSENLDSQILFPISYSRLRQVWEFYRPVPKKFHSLRHTFAIEIYKKTKDIRLLQVALGHRNVMNTMIYADYVYSTQELKRLIL